MIPVPIVPTPLRTGNILCPVSAELFKHDERMTSTIATSGPRANKLAHLPLGSARPWPNSSRIWLQAKRIGHSADGHASPSELPGEPCEWRWVD